MINNDQEDSPQTAEESSPETRSEVERLTEIKKDLEQALAEEKDKYDTLVRAFSEKETFLKREARLYQEKAKFVLSDFAQGLLGVSDNLELAVQSAPKDTSQGFIDGIEAIQRQLESIFEQFSIYRMDPLGKPFDPHVHEAMMNVEDSTKEAGSIAQVLQSGYMIHDRLLRAAKVSVVKKSEIARDAEETTSDLQETDAQETGSDAQETVNDSHAQQTVNESQETASSDAQETASSDSQETASSDAQETASSDSQETVNDSQETASSDSQVTNAREIAGDAQETDAQQTDAQETDAQEILLEDTRDDTRRPLDE